MKEKLPKKEEPIGKSKRVRHLRHEARFDGKIKKSEKKQPETPKNPENISAKEKKYEFKEGDTVFFIDKKGEKIEGVIISTHKKNSGNFVKVRTGVQMGTNFFTPELNIDDLTLVKKYEIPLADLINTPEPQPEKAETPAKIVVEPTPEPLRTVEENTIPPNINTERAPDSTDPLNQERGNGLSDEEKFRANPMRANIWSIPKVNDPLGETPRGPISGVPTVEPQETTNGDPFNTQEIFDIINPPAKKIPGPATEELSEREKIESGHAGIWAIPKIMQSVTGNTLEQEIEKETPLSPEELEELARLEKEYGSD